MPIKRVQFPDGSIKRIEVPEGATNEQIIEFVASQYQQPEPWQPRKRTVEDLRAEALPHDPTEGRSWLENAAAAYGKSYVDTGRGIKQLFGGLSEQDIAERRKQDEALSNAPGGTVGGILGQTVQIATPLPGSFAAKGASLLGRAAPFAAAGLRSGAVAGMQPVADGESRMGKAAEGAAWGVGGQAMASGGSVLASRAADKLSPVVRESIDLALRAGIPLNVSQVTDSPVIKAMQSATKYLPFSGAAKSARQQQEAFNAAVGRSFGVDAPQLTDDVMRGARKGLSNTFNDIYSRNNVTLTEFPVRRLADIERAAGEDLTEAEAQVVRNQVNKILRELPEDGVLSGQMYQSLRTMLQSVEDGGKIGRFVKQLRGVLDDAATTSVGPRDAASLSKVRGQWANLRTTEDALKQVAGAGGNVRPASLWPLIRNGSTKEMRALARIGQNVLKEGIGDSGTAQRDFWMRMLGGAGAAGTAAGLGVLPLLAKATAGGAIAGRMLNSKAAARLLEQGKPTKGLAKLLQGAPKYLPPAAMAATGGIEIGGGRLATPEDIARDEEIVRQFRARQGR